jgi:hypothetical protein
MVRGWFSMLLPLRSLILPDYRRGRAGMIFVYLATGKGKTAVIQKPYKVDTLLEKVHEVAE